MTVNALISGKRFTGNSYRFCEELKLKGYDVKATHKQQHGLNQSVKDAHNTAPKRQKGVYEVVDIGYDHYQNDKTKSKQHFIKLKTLNKGVEKTYWGLILGTYVRGKALKQVILSD